MTSGSWIGRTRLLAGISVFWVALSLVTEGLTTLVLPVGVLRLGDGATQATVLGLATFAALGLGMLVQPLAGAWSDRTRARWGRKGALTLGVVLLLGALALFGASDGVWLVVAAFALVQIAASVAQAAQQGFIPDLVPVAWRGTAGGLKMTADLGGALLAFVLLGQLLGSGSAEPALLATAAIVVVAFLATLVLVRERPVDVSSASSAGVPLRTAFRLDPRRDRAFVQVVFGRFLFLLATYGVGRFLLFFVADRLQLDPGGAAEEASALLAGLTLLTLLAAVPAGWAADRFGRTPLMLAGAVLSAIGTLLLVGAADALQILLFGGVMTFGSAAFSAANWAAIADLAPKDEGARYFGLANVGTAGASACAGLLGPLVDVGNALSPGAGYTTLFITASLVFLASAVVLRHVGRTSSEARPVHAPTG